MSRSDDELQRATGHVVYELGALVNCYRALRIAENDDNVLAANFYLEAMLVHARCLIEFIAKPKDERHIHRHDYLPGWELTDPTNRDEARLLYNQISKHLAHLSWERAEMATEESYLWSYRLPGFVVKLFEKFVRELQNVDAGKPWLPLFVEGVQSARGKVPDVPPSGGATTTSESVVTHTNLPRKRG